MRCDRAVQLMTETRYRDAPSPELQAHLAQCAECSQRMQQEGLLDRALAQLEAATPGPGFDTRFFARLAEEKTRVRRFSYARLAWAFVPVAALLAVVWLRPHASPSPAAQLPAKQEVGLVMDLELVQNLDVLNKLDELEDFDTLKELDAADLEPGKPSATREP